MLSRYIKNLQNFKNTHQITWIVLKLHRNTCIYNDSYVQCISEFVIVIDIVLETERIRSA